MAGPFDGALLINEAATVRLQLEPGFGLVVFVGLDLDAFFDDNNCDDLITSMTPDQSIRMAYTATEGEFTTTNSADGRSFQLEGIVLTPDPEYAPYADYTTVDVDLYDPIVLPDLTLGVVPYGVTAMPITD